MSHLFSLRAPSWILLAATFTASAVAAPTTTNAPLPINEVRTFVDILDHIKNAYVEKIDDSTLLENAIKGMLNELDPHSAYLDAKDFDELRINTTGQFGGLGLEVGVEDGAIKVVSPIDDTPAQRAGIQSGDIIAKIDGKPVKGTSLNEAVALMRGKVGSKVVLTILREGVSHPLELTLVRETIQVKNVKSQLLEPHYGYIRLSQFQVQSAKNIVDALHELKNQSQPLDGLILDLRNNPGGVLQSAVEIADLFLNSGLIVYTKGRIPDANLKFTATLGDELNGVPLVVLINGGSASASEIVAGALQDQHRAILMGSTSFGKGSVQTVLPLNNNKALKLTTALYYTPNGRSIQAQGIVPDIYVDNAKITKLSKDTESYREADLPGHLEVKRSAQPAVTSAAPANGTKNSTSLIDDDYQLFQALSLLKGLHVVKMQAQTATETVPTNNSPPNVK